MIRLRLPLPVLLAALAAPLGAVVFETVLEPIPEPNLTVVEDAVRRELEAERRALDERLTDPAAGAAETAAALGALGQLYHAYDMAAPAEACYRNAGRLASEEFRWPYLLGVLKRHNGELEAARESLERALAHRPRDLPAILHLAEVELDLGRPETAEARAREALRIDPGSAFAHYVLGKAAVERRDDAGAVSHLERALESQPVATRLHYMLAQAYRRLGDREAARRHLDQQGATGVGFSDPLVQGLRQSLAGAAAWMQRGAGARAAGLGAEAVAAYRRAVAADPSNVEARRDLGLVLAESGDLGAGIEQYREALRLDPRDAVTAFSLAVMLADSGAHEEALPHLRTAVELAPEHRDYRYLLASTLATERRFAEAVTEYQQLLARYPRDVEARLGLAMAQVDLGDYAAAAAAAGAVVAGDAAAKDRARAHHVAAAALHRQGQAEQAVEHLQRAVELDPLFADAHFALANISGMLGRFDAAAEHYRRLIDLDPRRLPARLGEATALALGGREAEAVARLEEGLRALPDEPRLAHALARLLVGAADPRLRDGPRSLELAAALFEAEQSFEHAETLAMALAAVGRLAEAAELQRSLLAQLPAGVDPALRSRLEESLERYERGATQ